MDESIQCYQCGTRMTLEELASNDGDCPECDVEIHLAEYLSKALTEISELRAQLPSHGGEAVAAQTRFRRPEKDGPDWSPWHETRVSKSQPAWCIDSQGFEVEYRLLYTHPVDQLAEGDAELVACLKFARTTMAVVADNANLRGVEYRSLIAEIKRIDAKLASIK